MCACCTGNVRLCPLSFREQIPDGAALLDDKRELESLRPLYSKYGNESADSMYDVDPQVSRLGEGQWVMGQTGERGQWNDAESY